MSAAAEQGGADPVVEVKGLVSRFGEQVVHDGLGLTVRKGEILGLVGGSGAGKTVLLNTLIGLRRPDGGEVKVHLKDEALSFEIVSAPPKRPRKKKGVKASVGA